MSDLQTAFYIIGIIFMSLMLLITVALLVAVFVIRNKIIGIHRHLEEKLEKLTSWAETGTAVMGAIKKVADTKKK